MVLVVLVVGGVTIAAYVMDRSEITAVDLCKTTVTKQLNAPSTAVFVNDPVATKVGGGWTVTGEVEGENQLGGRVTNSYECDEVQSGETITMKAANLSP